MRSTAKGADEGEDCCGKSRPVVDHVDDAIGNSKQHEEHNCGTRDLAEVKAAGPGAFRPDAFALEPGEGRVARGKEADRRNILFVVFADDGEHHIFAQPVALERAAGQGGHGGYVGGVQYERLGDALEVKHGDGPLDALRADKTYRRAVRARIDAAKIGGLQPVEPIDNRLRQ